MSNSSQWAAIVYGRRYQVDYSVITIPDDFRFEDRQWAERFIKSTTRHPEQIRKQPRWVMFKSKYHCIFGVTAMAEEILAQPVDEELGDVTRDFQQRPLYLFVGYVAKLYHDGISRPIPPLYGEIDLSIFAPLYDYVRYSWWVKDYEPEAQSPCLSHYTHALEHSSPTFTPKKSLENDSRYVYLYPESERQTLWALAAYTERPTSLYLGLAHRTDILETPFVYGTAKGARELISIPRDTYGSTGIYRGTQEEWGDWMHEKSSYTSSQHRSPSPSVSKPPSTVPQSHSGRSSAQSRPTQENNTARLQSDDRGSRDRYKGHARPNQQHADSQRPRTLRELVNQSAKDLVNKGAEDFGNFIDVVQNQDFLKSGYGSTPQSPLPNQEPIEPATDPFTLKSQKKDSPLPPGNTDRSPTEDSSQEESPPSGQSSGWF